MRWTRVVLLTALLGSTGCYAYHSVRPGDAPLDARVRVTVSPSRAAELAPVLRTTTPTVSGELIERADDHVLISVPIYGAGGAVGSNVLHNRVRIPAEDLVSVETRTLSKWRTGVAIGAVVAAVSGTWVIASQDSGSGQDKPGQNENNALITIFSVPLGIFH